MLTAPDVLIVGGGPAGAAAACRLASAGQNVLLCERQSKPRPQVCGEFLSAGACAELADLGILPHALGAAPITHVRLVHGTRQARARLPSAACGLSREALDQQLIARAGERGAHVLRGIAVRRLERMRHAWRAVFADGATIEAPAVLLATGKHDLRSHRRPRPAAADVIGFKMHWRLAAPQATALARHVELVWFDGGYAGLQPVERGLANLCLVLSAAAFVRLGRSWDRLLEHLEGAAPHLGARLAAAEPSWPHPATIAGVPYGHLHRDGADGPYRLGDQLAVIPSFAGEGIALALRTARRAALAVRASEAPAAYHRAVALDVRRPLRAACTLACLTRPPIARRLAVELGRLPGVLPTLARAVRAD
jgi:flavin-dependent dehydrogenase